MKKIISLFLTSILTITLLSAASVWSSAAPASDVVIAGIVRNATNLPDEGNKFDANFGVFKSSSNLTAWNDNKQIDIGGGNRTPMVINNAAAEEWKAFGDAGVTINEATAFQIKLKTAGYTNLKFSCTQKSTAKGPESFALSYSIGSPTGPFTAIENSKRDVERVSDNSYAALKTTYNKFALPAVLEDKNDVYLRVYMIDSTLDKRNNGNTSINDIYITGDGEEDSEPYIPPEPPVNANLMSISRTFASEADPGRKFNADSGVFKDVSDLTAYNSNQQIDIGGGGRTPIVINNAAAGAWQSVGDAPEDEGVTVNTATAFQIKFSTAGYDTIRFTCFQKSSASGPEAFALAYSIGNPTGPYTAIPNTKKTVVTSAENTYSVLEKTYDEFVLPAEIHNKSVVYLRVYMVDSELEDRSNGNTSINNIKIIGNKIGGPTTKGDINLDGKVNGMDLLLMKQHILDVPGKKLAEDTDAFNAADMNDDGKINGMDLLLLKKKILG